MTTLIDIAMKIRPVRQERTKPDELYLLYESYFSEFRMKPVHLLELGVYMGESTKVFATYFSLGKVVGLDIENQNNDFSQYPNVRFHVADQRNSDQLLTICNAEAPGGFDIIIDDAAHYGAWSKLSFDALVPVLKSGGLYVIEDWGTGYWDDWPDGGRFQTYPPGETGGHIPKRLPSHDYGMVGFVKGLVDEVSLNINPTRYAASIHAGPFATLHVYDQAVILKKR